MLPLKDFTVSPVQRKDTTPLSRCRHYSAHTWRRWSCILLRSHSSLWRSLPGSEDWGSWAGLSAWPTGPLGPRRSWRPSRSRRNPERKTSVSRYTMGELRWERDVIKVQPGIYISRKRDREASHVWYLELKLPKNKLNECILQFIHWGADFDNLNSNITRTQTYMQRVGVIQGERWRSVRTVRINMNNNLCETMTVNRIM